MQEKFTALKAVFVMATAAFLVYLRIIAIPLVVLILLMICDYISGMAYAFINHELCSGKGIRGIVKKLCYLIAVAASMGVDWVISSVNVVSENTCAVAMLVTVWLIINEIISILENISKMGIPLPKFLYKIIERLKNSEE